MAVIALKDTGQTQYAKYAAKCLSLAYQRGIQAFVFADELRRLCKLTGYSFPGMFVQAWHETAGFTSENWTRRRNPAGIKNASASAYQSFANGVDAARAFAVHMSAYTPPDKNPEVLTPYRYLDKRYLVALDANKYRSYNNYNDLAGHWAEDKTYGTQIAEKYESLLGAYE